MCMLCYSLESPHRGDSNEYSTYHYFIEGRKDISELPLFSSLPGAMINPQRLKLPLSRINLHGPKDVRAIEVGLYITDKK